MGTELEPNNEAKDFIDEISSAWRGGWWNYRILEKGTNDYKYYEIHEVYYDADGKIIAWTENSVDLYIESISDINFLKKTVLRIDNEDLVDTGTSLKKR